MEKYRAEVTGIRENVWSSNGVEFESKEAAGEWLDGLASRWFGFDCSRIVSVSVPRSEPVNFETDEFYHNYRK